MIAEWPWWVWWFIVPEAVALVVGGIVTIILTIAEASSRRQW